MEAFGELRRDFSESFLGLPGGIPDESAFRRVLQCLNPPGLQRGLENWLTDNRPGENGRGNGALVNINGKTIRESGFHVVNAWIGARTAAGATDNGGKEQ